MIRACWRSDPMCRRSLSTLNMSNLKLSTNGIVWVPTQVASSSLYHVLSYTRAFGDGPRNFEPWSSDDGGVISGALESLSGLAEVLKSSSGQSPTECSGSNDATGSNSSLSRSKGTLLQTCSVIAYQKGETNMVRILLDNGSERCWVTKSFADTMKLKILRKKDDLYFVANDIYEAYDLPRDAVMILKAAGMNLRKLNTNCKKLRSMWIQQVLVRNDSGSKSQLKEIWLRDIDWDDELPDDLKVKWINWGTEVRVPPPYGGVPHGLRNAAVSAYNRYELNNTNSEQLFVSTCNKRKGSFRTRSNVLSSADASDIAGTTVNLDPNEESYSC
ncbi:hypothetical protein TNCV_42581 [Trichonephila clavipes]|nr:hypothetical protein TNCV_42581 [Trichonephila clavipes]